MATSALNWFRENKAVYVGNAATTRDFRSQLRGNKPVLMWTAYLGLLILVMGLAYADIVQRNEGSVASIQRQLSDFYMTVTALLGGLIALVTPSLTATTVVVERQRKSLDLVFSSPVSLKYYLVGKMLSSLRYTWMLLVLALPITAVCVVMGGATWTDVIGAYILLTGASLVFTAIGLLMSILAPTVVSAVLSTYFAIIVYCIVLSSWGGLLSAAASFMGRSSLEQSWIVGLSPFLPGQAAPTFTTIHGAHVPNWALALLYSVLMCKLIVLGAASAMSPYGSAEMKSLRIHILVYLALFGAALAASIRTSIPGSGSTWDAVPIIAAWVTVAAASAMPTVGCYAHDADRRNRPDGWFNIRRVLIGTPSGGLPFALLLPLAFYGGAAVALWFTTGGLPDAKLGASLIWSLAYMCLWWGMSRFLAGFDKSLRVARTWVVAMFIVVLILPLPVIAALNASWAAGSPSDPTAWPLYILYPIAQGKADVTNLVLYAIGMTAVGFGLAAARYGNARRALERRMG